MSHPESSLVVNVDVANPGQVIACCGLLELAHRLWPGAEGWFDGKQFKIVVHDESNDNPLAFLINALAHCDISGLSEAERKEREELEKQKRDLKKRREKLPSEQEKRRVELGEQARAGGIRIGKPFDLMLDWWNKGDDEATPKTWAGLQELHKIARAAQDALSDVGDLTMLLDWGCVLRMPQEYRKGESDASKPVEPFYFDARRFAHALDVGFSLDVQKAETVAHPGVELLSLIGLQRFRPANAPVKWSFDYCIWSYPLGVPVAAAVFSGVIPIPGKQAYRFPLRFRDNQKRYKAFGPAILVGGEP